jgi:hypothetical protein
MEGDINFIKGSKMKNISNCIFCLLMCSSLSSCGLLCQAGTGTCGMSDEQAQKLLHPKTYGEFWTKPGMTTESWRQDWMACGGMKNGDYTINVPQFSTTAVIQDASKKTIQKLDICMKNKDYFFQRT